MFQNFCARFVSCRWLPEFSIAVWTPDPGGIVRGIARPGRVHDIEGFRPNICTVRSHPARSSPIAMEATITKSFDLHLLLDGKSKHRGCWSSVSIYNCLWNSMVDDLEHPPFMTCRCHLLHNFLSSSGTTSRRLRLLQGCKVMRGIRWACWKSSKATDEGTIWIWNSSSSSLISLIESAWIPMNEIEFLNSLFFVFWDQTKKPNDLENIPLSTVVTQVSIDSFTLTTSEIPDLEFRLQRLRSLDYRQILEARYLDLMSDGSFVHVFFVVLSLMN